MKVKATEIRMQRHKKAKMLRTHKLLWSFCFDLDRFSLYGLYSFMLNEGRGGEGRVNSRQIDASLSWSLSNCVHRFFCMTGYFGGGFLISHREVAAKMSKMSLLRRKIFRLKEKEKIPKIEWPELVGKVTFNFQTSSWIL